MISTFERFWGRVSIREPDECWPWRGPLGIGGYGNFCAGYKQKTAHRYAYELALGVVTPDGWETHVDHLCRNRACCNPSHLELVSARENTLRGVGPTSVNAKRTHCKHGHEFTPENIRWTTLGRHCRKCGDVTSRASMAARKGEKRIDNPNSPPPQATCRKGHGRTLENSRHYPSPWGGYWHCLICARETKRKWTEKNGRKKDVPKGERIK